MRMRLVLALALVAGAKCLAQDPSKALIEIYSTRASSSGATLGAGTLTSASGDILTAYHVVQGATTVEVYSAFTHEKCADVRLLRYDDTRDLAVINCRFSPLKPVSFLSVSEVPPLLVGRKGQALGFGDGKPLTQAEVEFRQSEPITGAEYKVDGKQLFTQASWAVRLLNIVASLPPGMSGGPVIVNGRLIGVVSGSEEVRATAPGWAMLAADSNGSNMKAPQDGRRFDQLPPLAMLYSQYLSSKLPLLKVTFTPVLAARFVNFRSRIGSLRDNLTAIDREVGRMEQALKAGTVLPIFTSDLSQMLQFKKFFDVYRTEYFPRNLKDYQSLLTDGQEIGRTAIDSIGEPLSRIVAQKAVQLNLPAAARDQKLSELAKEEVALRLKPASELLDSIRPNSGLFTKSQQEVNQSAAAAAKAYDALSARTTLNGDNASCSDCNASKQDLVRDLTVAVTTFRSQIGLAQADIGAWESLVSNLISVSEDVENSAPPKVR